MLGGPMGRGRVSTHWTNSTLEGGRRTGPLGAAAQGLWAKLRITGIQAADQVLIEPPSTAIV